MPDFYEYSAQYYDLSPLYQQRGDKQFYLTRARQAAGPVLEVACGSGRVLIPIAQAGVDITGLDASPAMLNICRTQLQKAGLTTQVTQGDMRNFDLGRQFSLITLPFRPFQHLLDPADQMACLQCVKRHLAPGGQMILDLYDPRMDLIIQNDGAEFTDFDFTNTDGRAMRRNVRRLRHDRPQQVLYMELIYIDLESGERTPTPLTMRYTFRYEMEHLLARCGFEVLEVLGNFDGSPVGDVAKELIFVAKC